VTIGGFVFIACLAAMAVAVVWAWVAERQKFIELPQDERDRRLAAQRERARWRRTTASTAGWIFGKSARQHLRDQPRP
jgi:hypothetical protein